MAHTVSRLKQTCDDHCYLRTGGDTVAAEAVILPAVHDAGGVHELDGVKVLGGDGVEVGYLPVAYRGHILCVHGAAEYVRKRIAGYRNTVKVNTLGAA